MAESVSSQTPSLSEEDSPSEEAVEDKSESPEVPSEEAPAAAEENNEETLLKKLPRRLLMRSSLRQRLLISVFRQQTKLGIVSHVTSNITGDKNRCVSAKGDDAPECDKFKVLSISLPGEWVYAYFLYSFSASSLLSDRWNEQERMELSLVLFKTTPAS
ncbi:hypothetical protein HID58_071374 [Brassica napus]|uniref:Uncharacterized protein n=1 Tax=Brassica napus TaxID=3708 RepID=A0ABQ7Z1J2_BRANA|nr:hypothetical protein HID58_071374 [Brassica napus]